MVAGTVLPSTLLGAATVTTTTTTVASAPVTGALPATTAVLPSTASATATTGTTVKTLPPAATPTSGEMPAEVTLVDATNFLTVAIPADWADRDVAPDLRDDGSERATIHAAPNLEQFYDPGSAGMYMMALPAATDPTAILAWFDLSGFCSDGGLRPYNVGHSSGNSSPGSTVVT